MSSGCDAGPSSPSGSRSGSAPGGGLGRRGPQLAECVRGCVRMAEFTRRALLARAGLAAGAVALGKTDSVDAAPDLADWRAVRAEFALAPGRIHLTSFLLAAHPRPVRAAIERHRRGLDGNPVDYLHANEARLTTRVRSRTGRYLGVPPSEIALTDSPTMGLGLLYTRLGLHAGRERLRRRHGHRDGTQRQALRRLARPGRDLRDRPSLRPRRLGGRTTGRPAPPLSVLFRRRGGRRGGREPPPARR